MNADERQQAIGNRLMKILVGLPRVDLDAGPQHRAGCNEHGQNSERPQRIVPDRALWMTRHKLPDVGQKAWRSHEIGKTRILAADKPPDKTKDKQDSAGPDRPHVQVSDYAVSFRVTKAIIDHRTQPPEEHTQRSTHK